MLSHPGWIGKPVGGGIVLITGRDLRSQFPELFLCDGKIAVRLEQFIPPPGQYRLGFRSLEVLQKILVKKVRICISVLRCILLVSGKDLRKHCLDLVR